MLHFTRAVAEQLSEAPAQAEAALQMFLTGALAASEEARLEPVAYEFMEQVVLHILRPGKEFTSVGEAVEFCNIDGESPVIES